MQRDCCLVGASDGGIVGLMLAMQRPQLITKLVAIGANFHHDGVVEGSRLATLPADHDQWQVPRQYYGEVSPDGPEHWPVILDKVQRMWRREPNFAANDLSVIEQPVLVISGDDDVVSLTHTVEMYQAVPNAQLAVVPGASHTVYLEQPELVNQIVRRFLLADTVPETFLPIRRKHPPEC